MFKFKLSKTLRHKLNKIEKKKNVEYKKIFSKVKKIINCNETSIDFYKNLRYDLSKYKRVHIIRPFVLVFKVDKINKTILFEDYEHHDQACNKKY